MSIPPGKTTVVKILSTLLKADTGTARVNGFDVAAQAADARGSISLTGQYAAVDEVLSGRENLVLVARLRHLKDPDTIADDLLERFALTDAELMESGAGDDPRLAEVADILASLAEQAHASGEDNLGELANDPTFDLLGALPVESDPRARRLLDLMRERVWTGWTRRQRLAQPPGLPQASPHTWLSSTHVGRRLKCPTFGTWMVHHLSAS